MRSSRIGNSCLAVRSRADITKYPVGKCAFYQLIMAQGCAKHIFVLVCRKVCVLSIDACHKNYAYCI